MSLNWFSRSELSSRAGARRADRPGWRRLLVPRTALLVVLVLLFSAAVGTSLVAARGSFDPAGTAVETLLDQADPMKRPGATEGVGLAEPRPMPSEGSASVPPLTPTKSCAEAGAIHAMAGIEKGSKVCGLSATSQPPTLIEAPVYAAGASGEINAFVKGANPDRIWATVEKPALNDNPDVYRFRLHY